MKELKKVAVLMATYNGERWLASQIKSIINQNNVNTKIFIRDDRSTDNTHKIIKQFKKKKINFISNKENQRSASLNFLKLILQTNENYDFYAFSDQDDIWEKNKLSRALKKMKQKKCEAYSSNISITKDNKKILMNKSNNQKKYDYIFEGVPGCTIVLSRNSFLKVKKELSKLNEGQLNIISMHDTFIYFFLRSNKISWYIDRFSFINYRQHDNNVIGVNHGFGFNKKKIESVKKRLKLVISGYYRNSILNISKIVGVNNWVIECVNRLNFFDRVRLILNISNFRRSKLDCFFLILILIIIRK
jgi:rhamnosyltransferase